LGSYDPLTRAFSSSTRFALSYSGFGRACHLGFREDLQVGRVHAQRRATLDRVAEDDDVAVEPHLVAFLVHRSALRRDADWRALGGKLREPRLHDLGRLLVRIVEHALGDQARLRPPALVHSGGGDAVDDELGDARAGAGCRARRGAHRALEPERERGEPGGQPEREKRVRAQLHAR
jgi:hypothetical protein